MVDPQLSRVGKRGKETNALMIRLLFAEHSRKNESHQIRQGDSYRGGKIHPLGAGAPPIWRVAMVRGWQRRQRGERGEVGERVNG